MTQRIDRFVKDLMPRPDRYPRPDWKSIAARVDAAPPMDDNAVWWDIAQRWVNKTCAAGGKRYWPARSENFLLASAMENRLASSLLAFAERARSAIWNALNGLAAADGFGPQVVFVFETEDEYNDYIAPFYPEARRHGVEAGVYIKPGYGHFALPCREPDLLETVVAHQLTHAMLSHLPLPGWLDEGIALNVESALCQRFARRLELDWVDAHRQWWDEEAVQQYWSGRAFHRADKLSELSYEMAWVTVRTLADDYEIFRSFALDASYADAGEGASHEHFGDGLGRHFEALLGDGRWDPDPKRWDGSAMESTAAAF